MRLIKSLVPHLLCVVILVGALFFVAIFEGHQMERIIFSSQNLGLSISSFINVIVGDDPINLSYLGGYPDLYWNAPKGLFEDILAFFRIFISLNGWALFGSWFIDVLFLITRILMILLIIYLLLKLYVSMELSVDVDPGKITRASETYETLLKRTFPKIKEKVLEFFHYFRHSFYYPAFLVLLFYGIGAISLSIDVVSFYIYLFSTFNIVSFGELLFSWLYGIYLTLSFGGPFGYILITYLVFAFIRKRAAEARINRLIAFSNRAVKEKTGVFTLVLGKMRSGKTTLVASLARQAEKNVRDDALNIMRECNSYFPYFPFERLEQAFDLAISQKSKGRVCNLLQAEELAEKMYLRNVINGRWDYDPHKDSFISYSGTAPKGLVNVMKDYAKAYFVYSAPSNLIGGNFAIRDDSYFASAGHFPLWDYDWASSNAKNYREGELSHVVDLDMMRLGRKKNDNSVFAKAAGPMVIVLTEFGKEVGSGIINAGMSARDDKSNAKNDLMDYFFMLGGHLATVSHRPMLKIFADEQRSGRVALTYVEIADSVIVADPDRRKEGFAMPLYWVEPAFLSLVKNSLESILVRWRYANGGRNLFYSVLNSLAAFCARKLSNMISLYHYVRCDYPLYSGSGTGSLESEAAAFRYFLVDRIDLNNRFQSDCMGAFLNKGKEEAKAGFFDLPTFESIMPSAEEWGFMSSHLVDDLSDPSKSARFGQKEQASRVARGGLLSIKRMRGNLRRKDKNRDAGKCKEDGELETLVSLLDEGVSNTPDSSSR